MTPDHPLARCAAAQQPVTLAPAAGGPGQPLPGLAERTVRTLLAVPLVTEGSVVGVLAVFDKPGGFSDDDQEMLTRFGSQTAIAIRNSQLYEHAKSLDLLKSEFVAVSRTRSARRSPCWPASSRRWRRFP